MGPGTVPTGGSRVVVSPGRAGMIGGAAVAFTGTHQGDLGWSSGDPRSRRQAVVDLAWHVPNQVHGARVLEVDRPGAGDGEVADALVTTRSGLALAVLTADCAPVVFSSPEGVIGVAHAGWRGLEAGVLGATVDALRARGASRVDALLGPCIHACCYEFGPEELSRLADRFGPGLVAEDREGRPALDLPAAVRLALGASAVEGVDDVDVCTACSGGHWSWRARSDTPRQASVVWR